MLKRIEITNFKAIGETPLVLDDLAPINYLVGPNGCGKSSVLEGVYKEIQKLKKRKVVGFIEDIKNESTLEGVLMEDRAGNDIINAYNVSDYNIFFINSNTKFILDFYKNSKATNLQSLFEELLIEYNYTDWDLASSLYLDQNRQVKLSKGELFFETLDFVGDELTRLSKNESSLFNCDTPNLFLVEEPEIFLHPDWQKDLPFIFKSKYFEKIEHFGAFNDKGETTDIRNFADFKNHEKYGEMGIPNILPEGFAIDQQPGITQFLISTHSPFIISAAGEIGDQNVYVIKEGQCLNPNGSKKGGAKKLAMDMLGAGVEDILPKMIVICESEVSQYAKDKPNYQKDAFIYQKLYGNLHDVGFYSAGSNEAVFKNNQNINALIQLIFNGQKSNTEIIGFVDSDWLTKNSNKLKEKYKTLKNTGSFNNIESFLFHESVLEKLSLELPKYNYSDEDKHANNWFLSNIEKLKSIAKIDWSEERRNFWQSDFEKYELIHKFHHLKFQFLLIK